jgi:ectoine hydroxylase-related dioxygenase (phytanoyl-CoA dioxygenase family)
MLESQGVAAARRSLDEHGYALLREVIPPELVLGAGRVIAGTLADQGWLQPGTPREELVAKEGVTGGMLPLEAAHAAANHPAVRRCLQGPEIFALFAELFGEPAVSLDFKWFRAIRGHATSVSGAGLHMDRVYMGRGSSQLHTVWLPWHDVPVERGGLAVLSGSHRLAGFQRLRNTYGMHDTGFSDIQDPGGWGSDSNELVGMDPASEWLTTDYKAGDLLVFTMLTMHGAVTNTKTNQLRLSADIRFQPRSHPVDNRYTAHGPEWLDTPSSAQITFKEMYNRGSWNAEMRTRTMSQVRSSNLEPGLTEHYLDLRCGACPRDPTRC